MTRLKKLGAIGECMLELSKSGELYQMGYGGDVFNTAVYAQRSGVNVSFLTATGDDNYSDFLVDAWKGEDIDTKFVRILPSATPALYAIEIDANGERSFQYWRDASPFKRWLETGAYRDELETHLTSFDCLYFSGITLAMLPTTDRDYLLSTLKSVDQQVAFDPNFRPRLWPSAEEARVWIDRAYEVSDIALPSIDDERLLRSKTLTSTELETHLNQLGVREFVIKQGDAELCMTSREGRSTLKPEKVDPVDTTAAGDAFNGAYLANRLQEISQKDAATKAADLARQVILQPGAIVPTN